jgi:hypothetical protein
MRGKVTIYKGYSKTPVFEESNLVVDGFKEQIVDMMTRVPPPSGSDANVSKSYDVSNFGIQGITLGPARSAFPRIHSLAALSGSVATDPTTTVTSGFDPSDGTSWKYNSDITNHVFSKVNIPTGTSYPNNSLTNPTFSGVYEKVSNGRFTDYGLNKSLSGFFMNQILGLYELANWDIHSYLRWAPEATEYDDTYYAGSCARHDFDSVSAIYSFLSGTSPSSTYAEPKDGILYIRSFAPSSTPDTSAGVSLAQRFSIASPDLGTLTTIASAPVLAEVTAQFSSVSGTTAAATIQVSVRDTTLGDTYNFSAVPSQSYARHSWDGSGSPLIIPALASTSGTFSKFINIPNDRINNKFEVKFSFFCASTGNPLGVYFWNAGVNVLKGWSYGNVFSGSDIQRVIGNDYKNPSLYMYCSGTDVSPAVSGLSKSTYISQGTRLNPLKKYCFNLWPSNASLAGSSTISQGLLKWASGNTRELGKYDLLGGSTSSVLLKESRLIDANYAVSPEVPRNSSNWFNHIGIKPSDLCVEVDASSTLSGVVDMEATKPALIRAEILKEFENGLSSTDVSLKLRTHSLDSSGAYRYFNFGNGTWDPSSSYTVFNTSSLTAASGMGSFVSVQVNVATLPTYGVLDNRLVLEVTNDGDRPAFIKNVRLDSLIPTEKGVEVFNFSEGTNINTKWVKAASPIRETVFSGFGLPSMPTSKPNPNSIETARLYSVQSMFAASASVHSPESEYEIFIFNNEIIDAGEYVKINCATMTDCALMGTAVEVSGDKFTSESYYPAPLFDIENEPVVRFYDNSGLYKPVEVISPGATLTRAAASYWPSGGGMTVGSIGDPGGTSASPLVKPSYTFDLSSITFPTSSTQMAFSIDYSILVNGLDDPSVAWQAAATITCGVCNCCLEGRECREVVWWDSSLSSWEVVPVSGHPVNAYKSTPQKGNTLDVKTVFTPKFNLTSDRFDEKSKVTLYILCYDFDDFDYFLFSNWKTYTITTPPPRDLPEFPNAYDTEIQTPMTPTAELGHFTNQIQFQSTLSGINKDRALGNANWCPRAETSSLTVSGVTYTPSANEYGVVNSDGFVLFGYDGLAPNAGAENGFHVSSTANTISYALDVVSGDYGFLDTQGGIEAIGLWTLDTNATYKKLKDNGFYLSAGLYDKTAEWPNGLYTLDVETRNPVFRLASKKVFREPLEFASGSWAPRMRIVWEVTFY